MSDPSQLGRSEADAAGVDLADEYTDPAWQGKQGITIRVVLQADDRTLTAREADEAVDRIVAALRREFGAVVR